MQTASSIGILEHINLTVSRPKKTAAMLCRIFGWSIRWEGASLNKGYTVHVGSEEGYLALYAPQQIKDSDLGRFEKRGGLNHIAVVVPDLKEAEAKIKVEGYVPKSHADYEPGRRFYFFDDDGVEYEVVSYVPEERDVKTNSMTEFLQTLGALAEFGARMK